MKTKKRIFTWLFGGILLFSCVEGKSNSNKDLLNKCPVVGTITKVQGNEILSVNQKLLKNSIRIPLSFLTEEMEFIHLDNRDEALVNTSRVIVTNNHLLVWGRKQTPFKLFDRKGKFICTVGVYGQGANEYLNIYDAQLDEASNRIYLLPWQSDKLLVYDLKGNPQPAIPLGDRIPKGCFHVDADKGIIAVMKLPFEGSSAVAWSQDMEGNRIQSIPPAHLKVPGDYSNEICSNRNSGKLDMQILSLVPAPRIDSLYHFDYEKAVLRPVFTVNFPTNPPPIHSFTELTNHFIGETSVPVQLDANTWTTGERKHYLIDKKTGKGTYCQIYNDFFGNEESPMITYNFQNGYYIANKEPSEILTWIEKVLETSKDEAIRKQMVKLKASLNENDNNVIFLARLKK